VVQIDAIGWVRDGHDWVTQANWRQARAGKILARANNPQASSMGWIVAIVLGLIVIGQCSSKETTTQNENPRPVRAQKYVHARALNCREAPSPSATVLRNLARNERVGIIDEQLGWAQISGEPQCWVSDNFLGEELLTELVAAAVPNQGFLSNGSKNVSESVGSSRRTRRSSSASMDAYYPNCSAARAVGAAPVYENDPGYSRRLDRDGDGVGCE
jgi:hypothetical protein